MTNGDEVASVLVTDKEPGTCRVEATLTVRMTQEDHAPTKIIRHPHDATRKAAKPVRPRPQVISHGWAPAESGVFLPGQIPILRHRSAQFVKVIIPGGAPSAGRPAPT